MKFSTKYDEWGLEIIPTPPELTGVYTWKMMRGDRYLEWVAMKNREFIRNGGFYNAT